MMSNRLIVIAEDAESAGVNMEKALLPGTVFGATIVESNGFFVLYALCALIARLLIHS